MSINVFMNHSVSEKVFISDFNPNYIIYSLVETNWSRIHIFCTNLRLSPFKTIAPCSLIISWVNVYTVCHVNLLVSLHTVLNILFSHHYLVFCYLIVSTLVSGCSFLLNSGGFFFLDVYFKQRVVTDT